MALRRGVSARDGGSGGGAVARAPLFPRQAVAARAPQLTPHPNARAATPDAVEELTRFCDQRARINFDPKLESEKDREIEIVTNELTRSFNIAAKRLSRLGKHAEGAADVNENKVVKNIIRSSAARLNELSLDFRKRQKQYLGMRKRLLDGSGFGSILGNGEGGGGGERDEGFTDAQMNELATAETEVDERMQEIQRIAKSVEDLAVLFKELNTLVVDQGTILDRIDYNMEAAVQHVRKGLVEIETADEYSKKARPTKCMIILMVLILIMCVRGGSSPCFAPAPQPLPLTRSPPPFPFFFSRAGPSSSSFGAGTSPSLRICLMQH